MGEKEREGDLCSRIGNWVQESVMMEDTDAGEHRPTSSSGAMLNGETYLVSGRRKGARTAGSKSRARTGTGRSGADVWAGDEKERVSRSRTRTSGIASRSRYTAPKLVSWTTVYDLESEEGENSPDRSPVHSRFKTAAPAPAKTSSGKDPRGGARKQAEPDIFVIEDETPGQVYEERGTRGGNRPMIMARRLSSSGEEGTVKLGNVSRSAGADSWLNGQSIEAQDSLSEMRPGNSRRQNRRPPPIANHLRDASEENSSEPCSGGIGNGQEAGSNPGKAKHSAVMYPGHNEKMSDETGGKFEKGQNSYSLLQKQATIKMLEQLNESALSNHPQKSDWRKNRDVVDAHQIQVNRFAAMLGFIGLACAVEQNELIIGGEMPNSSMMTALKAANSIVSVLLAGLLYYYYYLHVLFERIVNHLRRGTPLDVKVAFPEILSKKIFWLEILLCCSHLPPMVSFEIPIVQMRNFSLVRIETLGAVWNCLRLYLLGRCFTDWILARMPKRHTVATYAAVPLGTSFAFKQLFNGWGGVNYVMTTWAILLVVFGFWFRSAEMTACPFPSSVAERCKSLEASDWSVDGVTYFAKTNDLYIQNAVWAMLVTSTTVGYGDILPITHFSRAVAGIMALVGIVMASLLTAALSSALQFTTHEMSALLFLKREQARRKLLVQAVKIVQLWWRNRQGKKLSRRQKGENMFDLMLKFRQTKKETRVEVEDLAADSQKIDSIAMRSKYLETAVENIADKLWEAEMLEDLSQQQEQRISTRQIVKSIGRNRLPLERRGAGSLLLKLLPQSSFSRKVTSRVIASLAESEEKPENRASVLSMAVGVHRTGRALTEEERTGLKQSNGGLIGNIKVVRGDSIPASMMWRRKRDVIDTKKMRYSALAALFGLLGTLAAILQNELLLQSEWPESNVMNILKVANSACSIITIIFISNVYWLNVLFGRVQAHLRRGQLLNINVPWSLVLRDFSFWIEVLVCLVHNPPNYTFVVAMRNLENLVVYRSETIFCIFNTLRCYLIWRVITDRVLDKLPRRHTVAMFASVKLGKAFAFKMMLNGWGAIWYIGGFWALSVLLFGYWFRTCEISACGIEFADRSSPSCNEDAAIFWMVGGEVAPMANNLYMYNAIWCIFATTATVGYGDIIPTTHFSRFVCIVAAFVGIVAASLLTASLGQIMQPSNAETSATMVLAREKARHELLVIAQRVIAYWWRRKKGTLNHRQRNQDPFDLKMKFRRTLNATMVEVDDCAGMSKKIEQIAHRSKYIQRALDSIADKLWEPEVLESMSAVQTQTTDGFASTQSPMAGARLRARRGSFVVETEARMMSRSNAMFSKSMTFGDISTLPHGQGGGPNRGDSDLAGNTGIPWTSPKASAGPMI